MCADECRHPIQMIGGYVELVVLRVLENQVLFPFFVISDVGRACESGHTVVDVHDMGARNKVGQNHFRPVGGFAASVISLLFHRAEEFGVGQQH